MAGQPDRIYWRVYDAEHLWGREPETFAPVVLRQTGNLETDLRELWVETNERERVMTFLEPWFAFSAEGLEITGHVYRGGSGRNREERWVAQPESSISGETVRWRAEVVDSEGEPIQILEPASLIERDGYRDPRGVWAPVTDFPDHFWPEPGTGYEWAWRLQLRAPGEKRWVDDWEFKSLLPSEVSLEGMSKHRGEIVGVMVRLTPSRIPEAVKALGG